MAGAVTRIWMGLAVAAATGPAAMAHPHVWVDTVVTAGGVPAAVAALVAHVGEAETAVAA